MIALGGNLLLSEDVLYSKKYSLEAIGLYGSLVAENKFLSTIDDIYETCPNESKTKMDRLIRELINKKILKVHKVIANEKELNKDHSNIQYIKFYELFLEPYEEI